MVANWSRAVALCCCAVAAGLCILRVAISGSSDLLVLMLQRVQVLLGSHAARGALAGGGTGDAKRKKNKRLYVCFFFFLYSAGNVRLSA